MRDPKRIPQILDRLKKIWEQHPDLRLGQLIENVFPNFESLSNYRSRSAYNLEDEVFIKELEDHYFKPRTFAVYGEERLKKILKEVRKA